MVDILISCQFGDEGKSKVTSFLSKSRVVNQNGGRAEYQIIARGGAPNAGHTTWDGDRKIALRMLPSGILSKARLLLGPGALVNPDVLLKEIETYGLDNKRVGVDFRCTLLTPGHIEKEQKETAYSEIGSTKTGCGEAMVDKVRRTAKTVVSDPRLEPYLTDVPKECNSAHSVLIEGCQGFELSLFHGEYPYVTSRDVSTSALCSEIGVGPKSVKDVCGVIKSIVTRVGNGSLLGELTEEQLATKPENYQEFGTVTGRKRRVSETFDFDRLRYAIKVNSITYLALTKLDARFPETAGLKKWSELSDNAVKFVRNIEYELNTPVLLIGTGKDNKDMIDRR